MRCLKRTNKLAEQIGEIQKPHKSAKQIGEVGRVRPAIWWGGGGGCVWLVMLPKGGQEAQ